MDIAFQVANYLAVAGYGTLATSIFVGQIPSSINGIYVVRSGGQLNSYLPVEETVVDIYCKNTKSATCIATLEAIKRYIHRMHSTTTPSAFIYSMLVLGDVEDVDRDMEYEKLYKITVSITHRSLGAIS